jgi:hypothetical protein
MAQFSAAQVGVSAAASATNLNNYVLTIGGTIHPLGKGHEYRSHANGDHDHYEFPRNHAE